MQDVKQISLMNTKNFDVADENKLNRKLKYRPKLVTDLRTRFRSEYLGLLIQRTQYKRCEEEIQLGDVVLIYSDTINWPVIEIIHGKDGFTRLDRLQTATSEVLRMI